MRMCECSARPLSKRITRCLPTGSTEVTVLPASRFSPSGRAATTRLPCSAALSAAAARQIVSPSGTPQSCRITAAGSAQLEDLVHQIGHVLADHALGHRLHLVEPSIPRIACVV